MRIKKSFFILAFFAIIAYSCLIKVSNYKQVLRVGVNAFSGAEYFQVASRAKFFERAGLRIKLVEFGSLEDVQQAMEWHQIDGMICPLVDAMVIRQKINSQDSRIVFIPSYPNALRTCKLLVPPTIQTIPDLKNKRIGVEINSFGGYVLCRALRSYNLSLKDITLVPMDPTASSTFISHQWIDGIVTYPPFEEEFQGHHLHTLYSTEQWPKEMLLNVFLLNQSAIHRFHKPLCRFFKLWDNVLDLYKSDPESCAALLSMHYAISQETSQQILKAVRPFTLGEQVPLFCMNRYILDVVSNINLEILTHSNLNIPDSSSLVDHIFDDSLLRKALSWNP